MTTINHGRKRSMDNHDEKVSYDVIYSADYPLMKGKTDEKHFEIPQVVVDTWVIPFTKSGNCGHSRPIGMDAKTTAS